MLSTWFHLRPIRPKFSKVSLRFFSFHLLSNLLHLHNNAGLPFARSSLHNLWNRLEFRAYVYMFSQHSIGPNLVYGPGHLLGPQRISCRADVVGPSPKLIPICVPAFVSRVAFPGTRKSRGTKNVQEQMNVIPVQIPCAANPGALQHISGSKHHPHSFHVFVLSERTELESHFGYKEAPTRGRMYKICGKL